MLRRIRLLIILPLIILSCKTTSDSKTKDIFTPAFEAMVFDALPFSNQCLPNNAAENKPVCMSLQRRVYLGKQLNSDDFRVVVDDKSGTYDFDRSESLQFRNAPTSGSERDNFKLQWDNSKVSIVKVDTPIFGNHHWNISATLIDPSSKTSVGTATLEFEAPKRRGIAEPVLAGPFQLDEQGRLKTNPDILLVSIRLDDFCSGSFVNNCSVKEPNYQFSTYADPALLIKAQIDGKSEFDGAISMQFSVKTTCEGLYGVDLVDRKGKIVATGYCQAKDDFNIAISYSGISSLNRVPLVFSELYAVEFKSSPSSAVAYRLAGVVEYKDPPKFPEFTSVEINSLNSQADVVVLNYKTSDVPLEQVNSVTIQGINKATGTTISLYASNPNAVVNASEGSTRLILQAMVGLPFLDVIQYASVNGRNIDKSLVKNNRLSDNRIKSLSYLALPEKRSQLKIEWTGSPDSLNYGSIDIYCNSGSNILRYGLQTGSESDRSLSNSIETPDVSDCQLDSAYLYYSNVNGIRYDKSLSKLVEMKGFP